MLVVFGILQKPTPTATFGVISKSVKRYAPEIRSNFRCIVFIGGDRVPETPSQVVADIGRNLQIRFDLDYSKNANRFISSFARQNVRRARKIAMP